MKSFYELFNEAYNLNKIGQYDEAQNFLRQAEEVFEPNEYSISLEDVYILRGTVALNQEDIEYALDSFETALKKNPQSAEACLGLGQIFYIVEDKKATKAMFEWAMKNNPDNESAINALTNINRELGYPDLHNSLLEYEPAKPEIDQNIEDIYNNAYELFIHNKYSEALDNLNKLDNKYIEDVLLLKGNIYLADNSLEKAREAFETILAQNPQLVPAYVGLAEYFYKKGLKHDSKVMYEQALKIEPKDEFALVGLAKVNQELGLSPVDNLVDFFSNTEIGEDANAQLDLAYEKFESKNYSEALDILSQLETELLSLGRDDINEIISRVKNFKGFNYLSIGNIENARFAFEGALELNPDSSQACSGLGEVFYLEGNDKEAKIMFEWGVKNNRSNSFAKAGLAKVNKAMGLPADHNTLFLGIDIDDSQEFTKLMSDAYDKFVAKDFKSSIETLRKAEEMYDEMPSSREEKLSLASISNFIGYCQLGLNNLDEARKSFEKALVLNPESSQACAGLGEIFYLLEQEENAKVMYEWAVKNEPRNKIAIAGLDKVNKVLGIKDELIKKNTSKIETLIEGAYSDFEEKQYSVALEKLIEAEKLIEETFEGEDKSFTVSSINNFIGFNYLALGKNEEAKKHFEVALENNPESSQACAGLADVLFLDGKDNEAKEMYEWAIKNNPDNRYALAGLAKVNLLLGLDENDNSLK
jgi:tetratricopeptide (TPR) repeat protein